MTTIEDVKSRGYTHCTIDSGMYGTFLAKVEYQDECHAWNPVEVLFEGKWISIDKFDDMDGYNAYGCSDYRKEADTKNPEKILAIRVSMDGHGRYVKLDDTDEAEDFAASSIWKMFEEKRGRLIVEVVNIDREEFEGLDTCNITFHGEVPEWDTL